MRSRKKGYDEQDIQEVMKHVKYLLREIREMEKRVATIGYIISCREVWIPPDPAKR